MKYMKSAFLAGSVVVIAGALFLGGWYFLFPAGKMVIVDGAGVIGLTHKSKSKEELIAEALEKSSNIKALYMTADVAWDNGAGATRMRNNLVRIADETEINGFVIDVKEACGEDYNEERVKKFLGELHAKNIWAVARIVAFSDSSRIDVNTEWYLTRKAYKAVGASCTNKKYLRLKNSDGSKPDVIFWQDKAGRYWIDPVNQGARDYILRFSKKMIDLGFDELQYDYIRFPSDGDIQNAIYPSWDGKTSKCSVMGDFFRFLSRSLREHKPNIMLSADLFGYASVGLDTGIGQCIETLEDSFDYISFMVYPSHYYSGFSIPQDPYRILPAVNYTVNQARQNPQVIVGRSMLFARDFFDGKISTDKYPFSYITSSSTATSTPSAAPVFTPRSRARLRPWLEDFFHDYDKEAGRPYGIEKVRLEIDATENTENHGWMLWNAGNVYTEGALKKE